MNAESSPLPRPVEETSDASVHANTTSGQKTGPLTGKPVISQVSSKKSASAFRTISEVADELDVQQHVLRFWETKFSQIRPLKRGGGRRYYRPEDVDLLKTIHRLLYSEGYTIKGVQKLFREKGKNQIVEKTAAAPAPRPSNDLTARQRQTLEAIAGDLKELRGLLEE